jgi:Xaa-Pro aminopeptidase
VDHGLRRAHLVARAQELELAAILVTNLPNVRYLSGFTGSNGALLIGPGTEVFLTDGRYTERARHEIDGIEQITCSDGFIDALRARCAGMKGSRLGFEGEHVTFQGHRRLLEGLEGMDLVPLDGEVERRRWVKDEEELDLLDAAQLSTDHAFESILERLAVGISERQVAFELDNLLRREGADGPSFDTIVAFGENAAEPHHEPGSRALEEGDVIKLDFGALHLGYHSDMTRTVAFGQPAPELRKIHELVAEAQQEGIDAVTQGAVAREVDSAARGIIEAAGYGAAFTHGLGHGVGLEIHEGPSLGRRFDDTLPAGAVVTIEPGIYVPGLGGVRIEDMVEVRSDGCRVLGSSTRELLEL